MKNRATLMFSVLLLFFVSCNKEQARLVDFFVEFATVIKTEPSVTIQLDNGKVLSSKNNSNIEVEEGDRVILNYTPLEDGAISINSMRRIFLGNVQEEGYPYKLATDPIKIVSLWVSGSYLNLSFQTDYHSKSHTAALFRNMQAEKPTLYFSYSRGDDPAGAPTLSYLSFNLESLQQEDFTIYIHTYEEIRKIDLTIK